MDNNVASAMDRMAHGENITRQVNASEATRLQFSQEVWNVGENARTVQGANGANLLVKDVAGKDGHKSEVTFGRDGDGNRVVLDIQDVLNNGLTRDIYDSPQDEARRRAEAHNRGIRTVSARGEAAASTSAAAAEAASTPASDSTRQAFQHCMDASGESRRQGNAVWHVDAAECSAETGYGPTGR